MEKLKLAKSDLIKIDQIQENLIKKYGITELLSAKSYSTITNCSGNCSGGCTHRCGGCGGSSCKGGCGGFVI